MKFSKRILKAVNEGVYRALADLDDDEDIVLTKSSIDLSRADKHYNQLKLNDLVEQLILAKDHKVLDEILKLVKEYNIKYIVLDKDQLCNIIKSCIGLTKDLNWIDTSKLTDISYLTKGISISTHFDFDISDWDVSNIINAKYAFDNCNLLDCNLSKWKLSSLQYGISMFYNCTNLIYGPKILSANIDQPNCYENMFYHCTALLVAPELLATILTRECYYCMFYGCTSLEKAPELPATTLAQACYYNMFSRCTSLKKAPKLPATTLANSCYERMFLNCISLTHAPELPATAIKDFCYQQMFLDCKNLILAPDLIAQDLKDYCYVRMFYGCNKLSSLKCLAIHDVDSMNLNGMLFDTNKTGTFYKIKGIKYCNGIMPELWELKNI